MRMIFVDEAGTSQHEPVTVVAGVIGNADQHVRVADALVDEIFQSVPAHIRSNFVFHSTEVFGSDKYKNDWSPTDRLQLLKDMMSVPRRVGMAIAVSAVWRGFDYDLPADSPIRPWEMDHITAFGTCLAVADRGIRAHAGPTEFANVVAEDVPSMRRHLHASLAAFKADALHLPPKMLRRTQTDDEAGHLTQRGEVRISRIRNSVLFVEKSEDKIVQVADACAFGIRRYFANEKLGDEFANVILGDKNLLRDFDRPSGFETWWP